ncbi:MAG: DUF1667 domain-containing protein [Clostridia bacterium]|nr:DUF1667 domain-containing protein [Clostridia bacterium]
MKERALTCIVCPRGCPLTVTLGEGGEVLSVTGNACKRGVEYATTECTAPRRTVTTTVRCECGGVISVKTASTVPKEKIFEVMAHINRTVAPKSSKIGDVIIEDVAETGVAVVVTANRANR